MLYAPSHLWSCRFRAIACIVTVGSYALFGMAALLLIVLFLLFYPLFSYGAFRDSAVSVLVDKERLFVRQGLDPEIEYALHDVASFEENEGSSLLLTLAG